LAIGLDMSHPAVFRTGYHAGLKTLFIAYDFALVKDSDRFPGSADFRFVLYRFPANGGFRAAWEKFMEIFPAHFEVRARQQGLWMPFTDISKVKDWEDFGFRFHEGNNNVKWDDEHGILSFRYTEPMTWWMPMKKEIPRTFPDALRVRDEIAQGSESSRRRMAKVTEISAMQDETGEPALFSATSLGQTELFGASIRIHRSPRQTQYRMPRRFIGTTRSRSGFMALAREVNWTANISTRWKDTSPRN
jgi:hypothetical protein